MLSFLFFIIVFFTGAILFVSYERGVILFLFFSIIYPEYLSPVIGGYLITYQRITTIIVLVFYFLHRKDLYLKSDINKFKLWVYIFGSIIIVSFITSLIALDGKIEKFLLSIIDDFVQTVVPIIIVASIFQPTKKYLHKILKLLLSAISLIYLIAVLEIFIQKPILTFIVPNFTISEDEKSFFRSGTLRIISVFSSSLKLGYFTTFSIPILFLSILEFNKNKKLKRLCIILIVLTIPINISTGSRNAIFGMLLIFAFIFLYQFLKPIKNRNFKSVYFYLIIAISLFAGIFLFEVIFTYISNDVLGLQTSVYEDGSFKSRSIQYTQFFDFLTKERLFIGFGRLRTIELIENIRGLPALDSYWLRLAFESGIIVPIILMSFFITLILRLIRLSFKYESKELYLLTGFFIAYLNYLTFNATITLRIILFIIMSLTVYYFKQYKLSNTRSTNH